MNRILATSITTALFLVIGISGVMLYFGLFKTNIKELHEILGLGFTAAVIFHLFYNWKQMKNYFNKKVFISAVLITTVITSGFIVNSLYKTPSPKGIVIQSMMNTPIENSLKVLNIDYDEAVKILNKKNITMSNNDTIKTIAKKGNISGYEVISILSSQAI